ncbi:MAG: vWA domain-containing protein, partial [Planctomycetota bacterium]|nr:vWA domain-containing protein [Planctomycetota bacterium]
MKQFLEWYLGVPPAIPGQETRWQWSFELPWPGSWSPLWAGLVGSCLLVMVVWIYLRDTRRLPSRTRFGLIGTRLLATACVLLCLTNAAILIQRTGAPVVAILLDTSASMGLEDRYQAPRRGRRIAQLAGTRRPTRLNLAKNLLTQDEGRLLEEISKRFQVRVYAFDTQARPLSLPDETPSQIVERIQRLTASGTDTRPGPSVRQVLEEFRGEPPAAIVLVTDGIPSTSSEDGLVAAAPAARQQLVPLVSVAVGSRLPARDLHLLEPQVDDIALIDNPLAIQVDLQAYGLAGQSTTIRM